MGETKVKLSLKYKLIIPIVAAVVVLSIISNYVIIDIVKKEYTSTSYDKMRNMSAKLANAMITKIDDGITSAITLASTMQTLSQEGMQIPRDALMDILVSIQKSNKSLYGVWANWLPNKYDGMDGLFENGKKYMSAGHFAPMAFPGKDGTVSRITTTGHNSQGKQGLWYNTPLKENRIYLTDPTVYTINGAEVTLITIGVPVLRQGKVIGVAGVNLQVDFVNDLIKKLKLYDSGYAFLFTQNFEIFAHPNKEILGKNFKDKFADVYKNSMQHKSSQLIRESPNTGKRSIYSFQPLKLKAGDYIMTMGVLVPEEEVLAFLPTIELISNISLLIVILVVSLIVYLMVRSVSRQLGGEPSDVVNIVNKIAGGDFTQSIKIEKGDKSSLAFSVNKMASGLREMLNDLSTSANVLNDTGNNLTSASRDLTSGTTRQSDSASQIAAASVEMTQTVQEIARNLTEMAEYSKNTANDANSGQNMVDASTKSVLQIKETVDESAKLVTSLDESSAQIRDIVNVISEIAEQTNLLALNAAIEAARAGEHGRGFAVVADEVRGLAERTQNATVEISDLVTGTQGEVQKVTNSMGQVTENVDQGVTYSEQVGESLTIILNGINSLQEMVDSVSSATTEMAATSKEIEQNINNVASVSEEVSQVAENVAGSSSELSNMSNSIKQLIDKFKI